MADKRATVIIKGDKNKTMIGEHNIQIDNQTGHSVKAAGETMDRQDQGAAFQYPSVSIEGNEHNLMYGKENICYKGQPSQNEKDTCDRNTVNAETQQDRQNRCSSKVPEKRGTITIKGSKNDAMIGRRNEKYETTQDEIYTEMDRRVGPDNVYKLPASIAVDGSQNSLMVGGSNTVVRLQKADKSPEKERDKELYRPTVHDSSQLCREQTKYPVQEVGKGEKEKSLFNEHAAEVMEKEPLNYVKEGRFLDVLSKVTQMNPFGNNAGSPSVKSNFHAVNSKKETAGDYCSLSLDGDLNSLDPHLRSLTPGVKMVNIVTSVRGWEAIINLERVSKSIKEGLVDEEPKPIRTQQPNTVLCLDSSASMRGRPFEEMKNIAFSFLDGLDEMAELYDHEENVAVVSMSGSAQVVQNLTNDYSKVRDAVDTLRPSGNSPFFESIMVSLAAAERQDDVNEIYQCPTRLIVITDGKPTDEKNTTNMDDAILQADLKMTLIRLVTLLGTIKGKQIPNPIIWVPVHGADMDFLRNISSFGCGQLDDKDGFKLAKFFTNEGNRDATGINAFGTENVACPGNSENEVLLLQGQKQESRQIPVVAKHHVAWRWRNEEDKWCPYPKNYQDRIQKDFLRKPQGISLVIKGSESFRLYFEKMEEKSLGDGTRHPIDYVRVDDEEYQSLLLDSKLLLHE